MKKTEQSNEPVAKRPYEGPKLVLYGSVRDLTLSHAASITSDKGGSQMAGS